MIAKYSEYGAKKPPVIHSLIMIHDSVLNSIRGLKSDKREIVRAVKLVKLPLPPGWWGYGYYCW